MWWWLTGRPEACYTYCVERIFKLQGSCYRVETRSNGDFWLVHQGSVRDINFSSVRLLGQELEQNCWGKQVNFKTVLLKKECRDVWLAWYLLKNV